MNLLVIGSGGREHALCWKLKQSNLCEKLYCIPGNAGISAEAECFNINISDFRALIDFTEAKSIDLTVAGPETPLADGIVDYFQLRGKKIFGPSEAAARIESDKAFAKQLMLDTDIPSAGFEIHECYESAGASPLLHKFPVVIKASGLAAGKGVIIAKNRIEAEETISDMFIAKKFGSAGSKVVIEEFLRGEEFSLFALTDGTDYILFPPSQDHKRLGDKDTGPNTGGMGAYAPAPIADSVMLKKCEDRIIKPLLVEMKKRDTPYQGLLYCGLIEVKGEPYVLEFNCRFGDPETQCVLPLVKADLVRMFLSSLEEGGIKRFLNEHLQESLFYDGKYAVCVVAASGGYPEKYEKGFSITGLDREYTDTVIFHAGTACKGVNIVTAGGRVLGVTGIGDSFIKALDNAYHALSQIEFEGIYYRNDIGWRALRR